MSLNRDYLTDAQDACDEAKMQVQVEADAAPAGLEEALLKLAVDLGFANLDVLSGTFGLAQQETLQAAVDEFVSAWG
mgnify:CR=1 FL=1